MPELPEVETTTRELKRIIVGLVIKDVWTDLATKDKRQGGTIANPKYFVMFRKKILNKKILLVERRAKNILINLSGGKTILVHLKMTGHLLYGKYKKTGKAWVPTEKGPLNDPYNRFIHVVFTFSPSTTLRTRNETHLAFSDARKFGKITLLDTKTAHDTKHLNNIGPEPLEKSFNLQKLKERLNKKPNGKIKTVLMDQSIIAGIGNIYSDEILWRAGINPERKASKLKEKEIKRILKAIKETLSRGIDFGGDSMSDYRNIHGLRGKFQLHHEAYRRTGEKCRKKKCKGVIKRKVINDRSAHFCSVHQK
ncbi:DNA-formamidopyrimidine glycosylase [Candidatus Nomurabacteria bacterium RIFOXYC2_FULL_43_16]|uniref:DNA-formamidopyrimidine glycosylase n=2 Tax=Candidatus Nomuraibacteriota TaxID=1752729 RepID=A0A1F6YNV8_9BACT|nr:MAG: Formamidopyrimidine-DNA glycosylase [Parcubacteria group bacterium GW2011_GWC1_42_21]KKS58483.1 MAG: Formamidopyrimidine-DNA glycosylase [Candidatus Nomurabacteria bacterium GW2011_GWF1_42_40]KKS99374.1 MAG: Formamidopyrimidine-DNA glycosylase [Candidatus Nomurabacteria bacterium GW2011_GWA1_43_17]KKT06571.1 MAG: Formamidopyrimidine-DNA glycosylase [Candidatus Nomurabacteria bacterium GW2011_GWB1_43_19]KKT10339.1 MAG: Formamidopyrimidine-DNA glycosylase [Candidatus Nomurabacteria bacter